MSQVIDCYRILEVEIGASREDIIASYRRLCRRYHPDVSGNPALDERMKQINMAYAFLREKWNAGEDVHSGVNAAGGADFSAAAARLVMEEYFSALMSGFYEGAYGLLSDYDRRHVPFADFCDWRKSVERIFDIQDYTITEGVSRSTVVLKDGRKVPARKCGVAVTETNRISGRSRREEFAKLAVFERGRWRVFLGYRDLNTIAQSFKDMFGESQRAEMERVWRQWRMDNCEELGVLSLRGLYKRARNELYAYKRHGRPFVLAALSVDISSQTTQRRAEQIMRTAAKTVSASLRETDLAARGGEGELVILFAEMKKRNAGTVTKRLAAGVDEALRETLGTPVGVGYAYRIYSGGGIEEAVTEILDEKKERV